MEPIIVIVGFLGVGKTTFLKKITHSYLNKKYNPFVILNDYENATLDLELFSKVLGKGQSTALNGSCICCSGIVELRSIVNSIPSRKNGITLIEANGTSDACELMGFLAVGINKRYLPPIQISIVDVRLWQQRGYNNELEANQVQVSSLIVLNYSNKIPPSELSKVKKKISKINPVAKIAEWEDFEISQLRKMTQPNNTYKEMDHKKSHWSASSVNLPDPMRSQDLINILDDLPETILRVKGCTKLDDDQYYSFFERTPSGESFVRPYSGNLIAGPQLVAIGPGSGPKELNELLETWCNPRYS